VNLEKIEVATILTCVKEQIEIIGQTKAIELELINNSNNLFLLGDKNMLDAIFRNLISNAIKFSSNNSKIQLSISQIENNCEISIRDFGKGMSDKEIADFKKGIAFSTSGTANEKGHGLGLQLVKEFLHKQNSELNVESHPGFGSRFYFSLPIAD
jgi:signal transduction histidine kinase